MFNSVPLFKIFSLFPTEQMWNFFIWHSRSFPSKLTFPMVSLASVHFSLFYSYSFSPFILLFYYTPLVEILPANYCAYIYHTFSQLWVFLYVYLSSGMPFSSFLLVESLWLLQRPISNVSLSQNPVTLVNSITIHDLFTGPSRLLAISFSIQTCALFILHSSQFKSYHFFSTLQSYYYYCSFNWFTEKPAVRSELYQIIPFNLQIYSCPHSIFPLSYKAETHLPDLSPVLLVAFLSASGILPYLSLIPLIPSFLLSPFCQPRVYLFLFIWNNTISQYFCLFFKQLPHSSWLSFYLMSKHVEMFVYMHDLPSIYSSVPCT